MQSRVLSILRRVYNNPKLGMNKCNAVLISNTYTLPEMVDTESSANSHPDGAMVLDQVEGQHEMEELEPGKEPAQG